LGEFVVAGPGGGEGQVAFALLRGLGLAAAGLLGELDQSGVLGSAAGPGHGLVLGEFAGGLFGGGVGWVVGNGEVTLVTGQSVGGKEGAGGGLFGDFEQFGIGVDLVGVDRFLVGLRLAL
jgi:hypothetical protein